ncbi:MAG: single-stranded-DNA-specific exonuclease RecJ [Chthoniobacterales bacterium]
MERTWTFSTPTRLDVARSIAREVNLAPCLAPILARAELFELDHARRFLFPRLRDLGDPFLIPGLQAAVDRIFYGIDHCQQIVLYGDYDVDGVTSVAFLMRILQAYGADPKPFLPLRLEEGYGLSREGVERCLSTCRPDLLVALDCGTSVADRISEIEGRGVDVIVIDHHEPKHSIPKCCAFTNPKISSDYHYLCTAGLVFKLCHGLLKKRRLPEIDLKDYLDLVAIATVADLVPLVEENRTLVYHGLRRLEETRWIGLRALMELAGVTRPVRPAHISFRIGPRLNAAGRLGVAQDALDLLLTKDQAVAANLARSLDWQNRDRQSVEQKTFEEALLRVADSSQVEEQMAIVVGSKAWHPGVVGIVASRLARRFHRPTLVIGSDESGEGRGSGRSIPGFSLVRALEACSQHLRVFGGHEMAAGLSLAFEDLDAFAGAFRLAARERLTLELLRRRLDIDVELTGNDLNGHLLTSHEMLQPFGIGNLQPLFYLRGVKPAAEPKLVKEKHRVLTVCQGNRVLRAIHFNGAKESLPRPPWDVAFYLESNTFRDRTQLELQIEAIRSSTQS